MATSSHLDHFSELIEAAASVVEETDLERVLRRLVAEAMTATGARYAALGIIGEHGLLSDFLFEGISSEEAARIGHLPTGKGVLGTVIRLNKTIRLSKISDHPDAIGFPDHHPPMENFLGVPVAVGDEAFGNLYLTEKDGGFDDDDVLIIAALSRIAGAAVRTASLQERLRRVAVVEDRQRIARELHDSVIQELFAVGLSLQGLSQLVEDSGSQSTMLDAVDRLDGAVETLRRYIFELKHPAQDRPSLESRLEDLVTRMGSAYPAEVELHLALRETEGALADEVINIVSEAMSNALRHSSAEVVDVRVTQSESRYEIVVRDDGTGFDPERLAPGMGLDNLRSRLGRLGGDFAVESVLGSGTRIEASLPVS